MDQTCIVHVRKSSIYIFELSQKSDFQPSTTKSNIDAIQLFKPDKFSLLGDFKGGFPFYENKKYSVLN